MAKKAKTSIMRISEDEILTRQVNAALSGVSNFGYASSPTDSPILSSLLAEEIF